MDFINNGCGQLQIALELHPLTQNYVDAQKMAGNILSPQVKKALDNIVRAGLIEEYPEIIYNGGVYPNLIGKRIIQMDIEGIIWHQSQGAWSLDPITGAFTTQYEGSAHKLTYGYNVQPLIV